MCCETGKPDSRAIDNRNTDGAREQRQMADSILTFRVPNFMGLLFKN
jgi:hypothetical protein